MSKNENWDSPSLTWKEIRDRYSVTLTNAQKVKPGGDNGLLYCYPLAHSIMLKLTINPLNNPFG